jgi:hypothetical protein
VNQGVRAASLLQAQPPDAPANLAVFAAMASIKGGDKQS